MTRDQAIQCEMDYCPVSPSHPKYIEAGQTIDRYVRLGMLKLDEPKSAEDRFIELSVNQGRSEGFATNVLQILELAGLKIVSK